MKALHFSPVNNGEKPVYNLRTNGVTEEHKSSPVKNSNKVVIQKESLPEIIRDTSSTVKKESRSAKINWDEEIEGEQMVGFNWKAVVHGDIENIDQSALKEKMGEEQYKKYLDTLDRPYGGFSNLTFDKSI